MPASASTYGESVELTRHNSLEDQRALQVALELSLLSFGNVDHHHHGSTSPNHYHTTMDQIASLHYADEMRFLAKKSQNMTECVPVPSSEHVAEIVGRQGNYNHSHISSLCVLSSCVWQSVISFLAKRRRKSSLSLPSLIFPALFCAAIPQPPRFFLFVSLHGQNR